jgi:hypothetical protein
MRIRHGLHPAPTPRQLSRSTLAQDTETALIKGRLGSLAVQAVISERVSAGWFPVSRGKYREIRQFYA